MKKCKQAAKSCGHIFPIRNLFCQVGVTAGPVPTLDKTCLDRMFPTGLISNFINHPQKPECFIFRKCKNIKTCTVENVGKKELKKNYCK